MNQNLEWFVNARFGLFVHYGLYSMLGRGEWVMNRERLSQQRMKELASSFNPQHFDADFICDLALESGMKYVNLTTMHHDGFRLYDTELTDFNSKHYCGRDLVEEFVAAARQRNLKISLYHSLNNWTDQPDAVAALESKDAYDEFIANTFARIKEFVTRFNPIDALWYDGWWPFNAEQWKGEEMNQMVRDIQPHIIFNGRNGLPGDFGTPEGHMSAPTPWRPWEACITFNDHWGYHQGDHHWKTPAAIVDLLATAASNKGNLLFNIGPHADGSVPAASVKILNDVGGWIKRNGEAIFDTDLFTYDLMTREGHRADWSSQGLFTAKDNSLYHLTRYWTFPDLVIGGLKNKVHKVTLVGTGKEFSFTQNADTVTIQGLPEAMPDDVCPVFKLDCDSKPEIYLTGGMRVPNAPHPPYDPCQSDIQH